LFGKRETAAACAELDTERTPLVKRQIIGEESRIFQCLACGCEREWDRARNVFAIFWIELRLPVE
jgi:hypothetical protein